MFGTQIDINYVSFTKYSDFSSGLSSADAFVFQDEKPSSLNDGYFEIDAVPTAGLNDLPAINHGYFGRQPSNHRPVNRRRGAAAFGFVKSSGAYPMTGHALSFIVVIANAQVSLKVFPGVRQIVLGLGRQHGKQPPKSRLSFCVKITQNDWGKLLH